MNVEIKWCIGVEGKNYKTQLRSKFFNEKEDARKWFNENIIMYNDECRAFIYCVVVNGKNDTYSVYSSEDIYNTKGGR